MHDTLVANSTGFPYPRIGLGVIVRHPDLASRRILLGRRKGSHGAGQYSFPGGHIDLWETIEECALRELEEETGLIGANLRRIPFVSDDRFPETGRHYFTLYVMADVAAPAMPELREPNKCEGWAWYRWGALPEPTFPGLAALAATRFDPFI